MPPKLVRKLDYARERAVNAYWMLKEGKFKLIAESIFLEMHYRLEDVREWVRVARLLDDSQVQGSDYPNRRRVVPASLKPTVSVYVPPVAAQADAQEVAAALTGIVASLKVRDKHTL